MLQKDSFEDRIKTTSSYPRQIDSLFHIQKRFEDENYSDEVQAAKKKSLDNLLELRDRYNKARENNELSADEKTLKKIDTELPKIINRVQQRKYSAIKGYSELKKLLDGVIDTKISTSDEVEKLAREALKKAGLEGKFSNDKNFKAEIYDKNNKTVLLKKDDESDSLSEDTRQGISTLRKIFNAKAKLELGKVHSSYGFQNENDALIFKTALDIYFDNKGVAKNEQGELGQSGSVDDGHRNVESELREGTSENIGQERRDTSSEENFGQQRQNKVGTSENDNGTNAEGERPVSVQSAGTSSARDSAGNGTRGNTGAVQSTDDAGRGSRGISSNVESVEFSGQNFQITNDSGIGEGGLKTKFKQNYDAIKLLKQLESENRKATPSEQEILSKFNGWGTLASAFTKKEDWQKQAEQLKEILTEEEYKSALSVTTNAFYTSPEIARAIWKGLQRLGFKGGRILDPSMGSGIFFGSMPAEIMAKSELTGVELDSLSGRIAQQLYQKAAIDIMPFQDRFMPNNYYDLAITNVPFEETRIYSDKQYSKQGYMLHNYFFAKAIDKVRPGGLIAFITSTGTMQAQDEQAKRLRGELNGKADLIAAFKLPSQTFDKNAGTQVTTDILILQKRLDPTKPSEYAQNWREMSVTFTNNSNIFVPINEYFKEHSEHMIGTPIVEKTKYNSERLGLDGKGLDIAKELSALMENLPENIYTPIQHNPQDSLKNTFAVMSAENQREGSFIEKDRRVFQFVDGDLAEVPKAKREIVKDFVKLEKTLDNLLKAQLSPKTTDAELSQLRETLNKNYDDFVKKHGYLNAPKNIKLLGEDPNFGKVASIEKYKDDKKNKVVSANKADIFYKRTASPFETVNSVDNALDAMRLSLSRRATVDMDYMMKLTGKNSVELEKELGNLIYKNPRTNLTETAEEYLSGNVREKLQFAREAAKIIPSSKEMLKRLKKLCRSI